MNILFCASEVQPLIKTGGLADVCGSLPKVLQAQGHDVRILMPAYLSVLQKLAKPLQTFPLAPESGGEPSQLLESRLPDTELPLYLLDAPHYFAREGNPYGQPNGEDWPDNGARFGYFCKVIAQTALNQTGLNWQPDILHCNDWQTGLVPALLQSAPSLTRPKTLFTIHNLAYQGLFPQSLFEYLQLPAELWSIAGVEFYGQLSFLKAGLVYADWISTVSPTYAKEIQTTAFGCGLEGVLQERSTRLRGILNGVDYDHWHPEKDALIAAPFSSEDLSGKVKNKLALQKEMGLPINAKVMLIGNIGRLVPQKGIDLLLELIPALKDRPIQLVILGSGNLEIEQELAALSEQESSWFRFHTGYDEGLAHRIEAGADLFLMPSRFEPCGLNQIYSLAYGTLPLVRNTGGLADTVIGWSPTKRMENIATGFMINDASSADLLTMLDLAIAVYKRTDTWKKLVINAMSKDYSWDQSARHYLDLYRELLA